MIKSIESREPYLSDAILKLVQEQKILVEDIRELCGSIDVLTTLVVKDAKQSAKTSIGPMSRREAATTAVGLVVLAIVALESN